MRHLAASLFFLVTLSSCMILQPENVLVRGSVWTVSQADIHLAIAAARAGNPAFASAPVHQVIVSGHSELFVYFGPSDGGCVIVRREEKQWHYIATTPDRVVLAEYVCSEGSIGLTTRSSEPPLRSGR